MNRHQDRPITIIAFEALSIAAVAFEALLLWRDGEFQDPTYLALWLVISSLWIALVLWITRYANRAGRVIYSLIAAASVALIVILQLEIDDQVWVTVLDGLTTIVLMALLWSSATSKWMKTKSNPTAV